MSEKIALSNASIQNDCQQININIQLIDLQDIDHDQVSCRSQSSKRFNMKIDQMLQNSFVDTEKINKKANNQSVKYQISGESFFNRTNKNYYSQVTAQKISNMKAKKLQCQIGSAVYTNQSGQSSLNKARKLQILKIIKLIKVLFKFLRHQKQKIVKQIQQQAQNNAILYSSMKFQLKNMIKEVDKVMKQKDDRIQQLQTQIIRVSLLYNELLSKLDHDRTVGKNQMRQIYEQQQKRIDCFIKESQQMHIKQQQLLQKNNQLQNIIHKLQIQLSNLQYQNHNHQLSQNKLQYQNNKLQQQLKQLSVKLQTITNYYSDEVQQEQQNQLFIQHYAQLKDIKIENQLYLKEIQLLKKQLWLTKQQYEKVINQKQQYVNHQLNRYQEQFKSQVQKITQVLKLQIKEKDKMIQKYKTQQKIYLKILSKNNQDTFSQSSTSIIHQKLDNNMIPSSMLSSHNYLNNQTHQRHSQQSKKTTIDNFSDKFLKTTASNKSRFSQQVVCNQDFKYDGVKVLDTIRKQYITYSDGFKFKNGFETQGMKNKHNCFSDKSQLFNEKMSNIEYKLMKLNKSLDYKSTNK